MTSSLASPAMAGAPNDTFAGQLVRHPLLSAATRDIEEFIADPVARPICLLIGPSGVGKTSLRHRVIERIRVLRAEELEEHPERTAVLTTSVPSGQKVSVKWFYGTLLDELDAPLPWRKIDPAINREHLQHRIHQATEAGLRSALLEEIARQRPAALIFDEADHLTRGRRELELAILADAFKDLVVQTRVPLILIGTLRAHPRLHRQRVRMVRPLAEDGASRELRPD
jgi:hypothetical protein